MYASYTVEEIRDEIKVLENRQQLYGLSDADESLLDSLREELEFR